MIINTFMIFPYKASSNISPTNTIITKTFTFSGSGYDYVTEDWSGDCKFIFPTGYTRFKITATTSASAINVSPGSYLCFIDSDWVKQIQVPIMPSPICSATAGKQYCFCHWIGSNSSGSITIKIEVGGGIESSAITNNNVPSYN